MKQAFFSLSIFLFSTSLFAQIDTLRIVNDQNKKVKFTSSDLQEMPQTMLKIGGEDGLPHTYSGVEIQFLLSKAGVSFSKENRKQNLNSYMHMKAADGYSVIYALTEVDSALSTKQMILALMKDEKALPQNVGPFQIIATGEKKHARMIRMVTEIDVRKAE